MSGVSLPDEAGLDPEGPSDPVVRAPGQRMARCRIPGTRREVTPKTGDVQSHRLNVEALGLRPLKLSDRGIWDPAKEYWGEEGEPLEEWARPIVAFGPRPSFEMEQVLPGADLDDWDTDPILMASELEAAGDRERARRILLDMLQADLRCLDAHAHLGNFTFDREPEMALRHYEAGVRIGELSLGEHFGGCLLWGHLDNRPFLRCLHGFGLCLWRLGRTEEAAAVFERMLWLNPTDNQGVHSILPSARAGEPWRDDQ